MNVVYLLPLFLIGLTVPAFGEVEQGANYDKEFLQVLPDGQHQYHAKLFLHDRIFDDITQTYKDYIFTDNPNSLQVETMGASVTLDKNTCGFSFHNRGYISDNPTPLLTDNITPFSQIQSSDIWNEITQISNVSCQVSWDGQALTATKESPGIGMMEYKYIYQNGKWKTQLEATNLTGLTDRVFGFDQTIDLNRDIVFYGGAQRNLDNYDGQTFNRTWLENNQGKIIEFLNGYNFDFDLGFEYLDSISIIDSGENKSKLVFHYMRNNEVLLPGDTLIIDPTWSNGTSAEENYEDQNNSGTCDTASVATATLQIAVLQTASSHDCYLAALEYDVSIIDDGATINDSSISDYSITGATSARACDYVALTKFPSTDTNQQVFDDILVGTTVVTADTGCQTDGTGKSLDLTGTFDSYVESQLAADIVGIGLKPTSLTQDATSHYQTFGASPTLDIIYNVIPTPDAVDDLSSPSQSYGTICLQWTEPNLNGGNLTGYQINYTTPYGNPTTVITNDTQTSDVNTCINGLSIGTSYTFGVSPWTEGGNNATKPPMTWFNVTTEGNFPLGDIVFNQTNSEVLPITFEEQSINSTAKFLNVTFANTYDMACDFHYKFANTNNTYDNLTSEAVSTTLSETSFIFVDFENEIIDVYCWDQTSGTYAKYLLIQNDFPLLQQIAAFRAGEYGTDGNFGIFDFVTLAVVIVSMIGLNRVNESVGAVFNIALLGSLAFFEIIELPTVIFGIIALVMVFIITSTRKT